MDTQLLALVVHDLKNAMGTLEARLGRASQQAPDSAELSAALSDCQGLRQRFVQFLTLYGLQGTLRAVADDESPGELLERLQQEYRIDHPQFDIQLAPLAHTPPFWHLDARLVRLALGAALHNATRFARRQIQLQALTSGPYLVFRVDDDGPGLGSHTSVGGHLSTGLGTALCEAVAAAHRHGSLKGRCELRNGPLQGARFELWLP